MKLLNDLFEIRGSSVNEADFTTTIELFPGHIVYAGHFPGYPVTPGVIQLQIVHELIENHLGERLQLITIDYCKFLKIINPEEQKKIQISVEYVVSDSLLHIKANGKLETELFFKFKGMYQFI